MGHGRLVACARPLVLVGVLLLGALPAHAILEEDRLARARNERLAEGQKLAEAGRYGEAEAIGREVLAADPDLASAWSLLGFALRKQGRLGEAREAYERALALDPVHRGANEYMGELWLQLGDLGRALERLAVLEATCPEPCAERRELEQAIAAHRATAR
ncbi:MAG: tetratricopeptide repeat protein [Geminicoccaceae bacterium]|nr:tetratricopeptide repeat protein [Geminicoccaceae bacterium]MDW8370462.1 tetratricopeptide repeat protein [Geminicoccaceae bacterium]